MLPNLNCDHWFSNGNPSRELLPLPWHRFTHTCILWDDGDVTHPSVLRGNSNIVEVFALAPQLHEIIIPGDDRRDASPTVPRNRPDNPDWSARDNEFHREMLYRGCRLHGDSQIAGNSLSGVLGASVGFPEFRSGFTALRLLPRDSGAAGVSYQGCAASHSYR